MPVDVLRSWMLLTEKGTPMTQQASPQVPQLLEGTQPPEMQWCEHTLRVAVLGGLCGDMAQAALTAPITGTVRAVYLTLSQQLSASSPGSRSGLVLVLAPVDHREVRRVGGRGCPALTAGPPHAGRRARVVLAPSVSWVKGGSR